MSDINLATLNDEQRQGQACVRHMSDWEGRVPLILEDTQEMGDDVPAQPEYAVVWLTQGVREAAPRIWCGKGETSQGWHLTPAEARELAAALEVAVDMAQRGRNLPRLTAA